MGSPDELAVLAPCRGAELGAQLRGLEAAARREGKAELCGQAGEEALARGTDAGQTAADALLGRSRTRRTEELGNRTDRGSDSK
jgi:hypothetical protein